MNISPTLSKHINCLFWKSLVEIGHNLDTPTQNLILILQRKVCIGINVLILTKETPFIRRILSLVAVWEYPNSIDGSGLLHCHTVIKPCLGSRFSHIQSTGEESRLILIWLMIKVTIQCAIIHDHIRWFSMLSSISSSNYGTFHRTPWLLRIMLAHH